MVLSLVLMSFAMMTVLFSYNASQLNLKGTKLQQTADNTAYSVASIAARDLNFKAYTNRAAVANQIAVAQMVGLSSWFEMTDKFGENACYALCWVPYVGQVIRVIQRVVRGMNQVAQPLFRVMVYAEDAILYALSESQRIVHFAGIVSTAAATGDVVRANDPQASLDWVQNPLLANDIRNTWFSAQKRHSRSRWRRNSQSYQDFIGVTASSKDPFTQGRSYRLGGIWSVNLGLVKWKTYKTGGSDLIENRRYRRNQAESWTGVDTLSMHYAYFRCSWRGCGWRRREIPVGWGGTRSDNRVELRRQGNRNLWGGSGRTNRSATWLAKRNQQTRGGYNGVRPFYALSDRTARQGRTDNLAVVVSKAQNNVRTTSVVTAGNTRANPAINEQMSGDRMTALAAAQAYYSRPRDLMSTLGWRRSDNKHEYGNLYNPYWQPRLSDTTNGERAFVLTLTELL
ncbi:hypothetical protein L2725_08635 [Shewanella corallii]|uniref:Flp pilus-assembly TadG-like N-terminal domain-containing protein n=1 Tax=Shewanella corallii TaxID=560080 RepID=A0ABT0N5X5_9GAMM|nr:hypothetical protein [Shewanella corallii]MCL2913858.1 hypothetical protein [Shewanella corallii]